ncbi:uncharacterized protein LAESUDRAFT_763121 [Laetiporus sulphureus 93-53]|uniref:Protein kinase domain-containing protein n=1 Tax=Laetiporus sulphureus 93-53 TaxID=1314785 RepID=A0A165C4C6_9APHY|nr:uncharacterized protein LAESUDRAFT_763121 [Laetiporus sulphureus 93-53]KZT02182.1 hypothetical protein LAESUDRAFT_763121 [Laetiporus sulphureus 93-53]
MILDEDDVVGNICMIRVDSSWSFAEVRRKIYEKEKYIFERLKIPPSEISIYTTLPHRVKTSVEGSKPIVPLYKVGTICHQLNPDDMSIHLVLVARPLAYPIIPAKRRPSTTEDEVLKRIKTQKIALNSPSNYAHASTFARLQTIAEHRVLNDRPVSEPEIAPIALLYDGFGVLTDMLAAEESENVHAEKDAKFFTLVRDFADAMCLYYADDLARMNAGLRFLQKIFNDGRECDINDPNPDPDCICVRRADADGNSKTDGNSVCVTGAADLMFKFKNEQGTSGDPVPEGVSYIAHFHRMAVEESSVNEKLYSGWRVPSLLVTVAGAVITFHAVVAMGNYRVVPLTPPMWLVSPTGSSNDMVYRRMLIRAFKVAVFVRQKIREDTAKMRELASRDGLTSLSLKEMYLPNIISVTSTTAGSPPLGTKILEVLLSREDRLVYFAKRLDADQEYIIIKVTRRYTRELHEFCAERGHAPRLLGFDRVSDGWSIVAMEYVQGQSLLESHGYLTEWRDGLKKVVDEFHSKGLVHGDL